MTQTRFLAEKSITCPRRRAAWRANKTLIALLGGRRKPKGYPIAVAWGQHHVGEDGTQQTGISRTESAAALTGYKLPTDPAKQHGSKMVPVPGVTRGMKSDPERGHYDPGMAHRVVGEACRIRQYKAAIRNIRGVTEHEDRQKRSLQ